LSQFIAEEELVMPRIGAIIKHPVVTRVVSIFFCLCTSIDNTKLGGGGNEKHWGFIHRTFTIRVNEVDKGWYPG
jgi:hypothetical protein